MTILLENLALARMKSRCIRTTRRLMITVALIFFGLIWMASQLHAAQDLKELFSEAQSSFEAGLKQHGGKKRLLMIKAAGQFRALIEIHGIENGNLYYNMGNAFFEAGEIGSAILAYRRAEKLIPDSEDLQYNLRQARSTLNLPPSEQNWTERIIKGLVFWHYMIDYKMRRMLFYTAFLMIWVLMAVMIFKRHVFLRIGFILMVAMTLGFGSSYLLSYYDLNFVKSGVIVQTDGASVRKGPGAGYESFYQKPLPGGTEFVVTEERGNWLKVRLFNTGDEVWIQRSDIGLI